MQNIQIQFTCQCGGVINTYGTKKAYGQILEAFLQEFSRIEKINSMSGLRGEKREGKGKEC